jgi:hypothetical protein
MVLKESVVEVGGRNNSLSLSRELGKEILLINKIKNKLHYSVTIVGNDSFMRSPLGNVSCLLGVVLLPIRMIWRERSCSR